MFQTLSMPYLHHHLQFGFQNSQTVDRLKNFHYNVLKIDMKCPEKYIKAYIFFIIQWIEFKFEYVKYISIQLTNI